MSNNMNSPAEVAELTTQAAINKSKLSMTKMILLGIMAGLCIALGAEASNVAMHNIGNVGVARLVAGTVFPVGLITMILLGGELFTGNCMITMGVLDRKVSIPAMLRNWVVVYFTNMIGAVFVAVMVYYSGQFNYTDGLLGAMTIKVALGKVSIAPVTAIVSGVMCNVFVCAAVMMATAAKDVAGKCLAAFFPICAFVISGFEHCVANMYYIPAGILAAKNDTYVAKAKEAYGITSDQLANLDIAHFFGSNLVWVTIGNIIGGGVVIGAMYYYIHVYKKAEK